MTDDIGAKVKHVLAARQDRTHHCHWPDCALQVPPAKWGCKRHWFLLPKSIRDAIWKAYATGQEVTRSPSSDYMAAARAADRWARDYIAKNERQQGKLL